MSAIREFSMKNSTFRGIAAPIISAFAVLFLLAACGELTGPKSPSTPTGVTATLLSGTSVKVSWTPSPLNDGVVGYSVYRNGTKVGESATTTFTDTGLPQQQVFKYTVAANCNSGLISDQSAESATATVTTLDVTPPTVTTHQPPTNFVGVSSGATATATFSEAIDPATINASTFILKVTSTGAVIPGTVTYTAATRIAEFKPTSLLPNPANITATVTTGVKDLAGNKMAADFSWAFTTRDDTTPTVIATSPVDGASGVAPTAAVTVTFSEAMDPTTISTSTITLKVTATGAAVPGTVSYNTSSHVATFLPSASLAQATGYTLTVAPSVKDVAGNPMGSPFSFSFTTGDTVAPTVVSVSPANLSTNVPVGTAVVVTFSEPMTASTVTGSTVFLTNTATSAVVPATVTYSGNVATLQPTAALAGSTTYTVTVTTGVKDLSGNPLATPFNSVFTTLSVDTIAPTVISVVPANGAANVATNATVQVTFSEAMDSSTINATNVTLKVTTTSVLIPAAVVYNPVTHVATLTPSSPLANATGYTVTVTTGAKDVAGNALASPFNSTFTTAAAADTTAPTIISRNPADLATGIKIDTVVTIKFSEAMDSAAINTTTIKLLVDSSGVAVAGTVTYITGTNTARFVPAAPLSNSTKYRVVVTTGVKDLAGNALAAQSTSTFTTVADTTAPTITVTSPVNNATTVPISAVVTVGFSEAMDSTTIVSPATNIKLNVTTGGAAVAGTVTYNATTHVATFTPTSPLLANTNYTATVTSGVKDLAGNPLALNQAFTFTTAP